MRDSRVVARSQPRSRAAARFVSSSGPAAGAGGAGGRAEAPRSSARISSRSRFTSARSPPLWRAAWPTTHPRGSPRRAVLEARAAAPRHPEEVVDDAGDVVHPARVLHGLVDDGPHRGGAGDRRAVVLRADVRGDRAEVDEDAVLDRLRPRVGVDRLAGQVGGRRRGLVRGRRHGKSIRQEV